MTVPATRTLPAVLRALTTAPTGGARLLVGAFGAPVAAAEQAQYANVVIEGVTVKVPKLAGVTGSEGQVAYVLAAPGRMIVIGTVTR